MPVTDPQRLHHLQDELLALKGHVGSLRLKKAAPGSSPSAPFPITATGEVELPPEAARYDVEGITVRVTLTSPSAAPPTTKQQLATAVQLQVLSPSLPASLTDAIAGEVHQAWLATLPDGELRELQLGSIWDLLRSNFVRLISLQPHLLEPYEGVDDQGRTIRRFAILNDRASLQIIDTSLPGHSRPEQGRAGQGSRSPAGSGVGAVGGGGGSGSRGIGADSRAAAGAHAAAGHSGAAVRGRAGAAGAPAAVSGAGARPPLSSRVGSGAGLLQPPGGMAQGGDAAAENLLARLPAGMAREIATLRARYGAGSVQIMAVQQQQQQQEQQAQQQRQLQPSAGQGQASSAVADTLGWLSLAEGSSSTAGPAQASSYPAAGAQEASQGSLVQLPPPAYPQPPATAAAASAAQGVPPAPHPADAGPSDAATAATSPTASAAPLDLLELSLSLRPTDPAWDPTALLQLHCTLSPASYPAPGSLSLSLSVAPPLPSLQLEVLQKLAAAEVAGAGGTLRGVVRYLENHGGNLVRDAEDLAVEVSQRRRAAAAAAAAGQQGSAAGANGGWGPAQGWQREEQAGRRVQGAPQSPPGMLQGSSSVLAGSAPRELAQGGASAAPQQPLSAGQRPAVGSSSGSSTNIGSRLDAAGGLEMDGSSGSSGSEGSGSGSEGSGSGSDESSYDSEYDEDYDHEEGSGSGSQGHSGDEERQGGLGHSEASTHSGLLLRLEGLSLADCDSLEILRLNLQVMCLRCRRAADITFATDAVALPSDRHPSTRSLPGSSSSGGRGTHTQAVPRSPAAHPSASGGAAGVLHQQQQSHSGGSGGLVWSGECGHCHNPWAVSLAPKIVHERSNLLGVLQAEGCVPQDLLPSMLAGQCGRCGAAAAFRSVRVGAPNERTCGRCHERCSFQFSSALFAPAAAQPSRRAQPSSGAGGAARAGVAAAGAAAAAFNGVLTPGQPLPDLGTCRHYRHSHRWLRFPCCGRRFPCDLCHEELTDGHEMKWAARMVCGYCSREQPLGERCAHCSKKLATSAAAPRGRNTRYWEGGAGCRDPARMTRRDPRKFRGSKAKTQSRKAARVGQRGAERRDARAARA